MLDHLNFKGSWFLPNSPANKISGILIFDGKSDGILELFGSFESNSDFKEQDLILGITTEGKAITLYNCFQFSETIYNGLPSSKYTALNILIGQHYYSIHELMFFKIEANFKNLNKWINKYGFTIDKPFRNDGKVKVDYEKPSKISFKINENLRGELDFWYTAPLLNNTQEIIIKQTTYISLINSENVKFNEIINSLMLFQNFLTVGTLESAYPKHIALYKRKDNGEMQKSILFYKPGFDYTTEDSRFRFLFRFTDIEPNFESILQKWYILIDKIDPVINLLLETFYIRESSPVNRLLNLVQSLETFHRRLKNYEPFPKKEYREWLIALVDSVDDRYKEVLKGKMDFGNEPSLQIRLSELVEKLSIDTINRMIEDKVKFIAEVKNTRNYYTHYSENLRKKALKGNDLYKLNDKLKILLLGSVLLESGFTLDEINNLFKRIEMYHYNHLLNRSVLDDSD